jgi:hypothetical protein
MFAGEDYAGHPESKNYPEVDHGMRSHCEAGSEIYDGAYGAIGDERNIARSLLP